MATAKKKPTKKSTAAKPSARKTLASQKKAVSFASKSDVKFMQARFSEQTVYWLIIGVAVIALAVWVLSLQVKLDDIYDQIDAQTANSAIPVKKATQ